jgi:hypothetical protein
MPDEKINTDGGCQVQGLFWQISAAVTGFAYHLHQFLHIGVPPQLEEHEQVPVSFAHALGQMSK